MKTNRAYGFALATAFAILAACSGNNQGVQDFGPDGGVLTPGSDGGHTGTGTGSGIMFVINDAGMSSSGTGTGTGISGSGTGGGGGACPSSCTSDSECQSGCPASAGAINCCDTVTSACFTSASSSCPDETSSGSGSGGY